MSLQFPKLFIFGVADADLQVIGEKYTWESEQAQQSMWHHFATTSRKCHNKESPAEGIDRYHLWKEDIEIMKRMGILHYRTSVSMSRILRQDGTPNSKATMWYEQYFKTLRNAGVKIYATLYHWELPQYVSEQGGWKNKKTIDLFLKHAKTVVRSLGEYIEEYFILNEPRCSSLLSHYYGFHAPGETNLAYALLAAHNLLLAQGVVFRELKSQYPSLKLNTVVNLGPRYALTANSRDVRAAKIADAHKNTWFTDPVFLGAYPPLLVELYGKAMPHMTKKDMGVIKIGDQLHALGVNYYRGDLVTHNPTKPLKFTTVINPHGKRTGMGWPIYAPPHYPEGLYDILAQVYYSYKEFGLQRLYITENGIALKMPWDGKRRIIDDTPRIEYIQEHLRQTHKAITRGIPVQGYFAWTLMDNYEWAEGYRPDASFGLIHVDRSSMRRVWKKSAQWYQGVVASRSIES